MNGKGQFSLSYELLSFSKDSSIKKLEAWKLNLHEDIQEEEWEIACFKAQTQSVNTKFKLPQYKWLMQTYLLPSRLSQMVPNIPDFCAKCREQKGTLLHCQWECRKLQPFWKSGINCISLVIGKEVSLCAKLCILGIYPEDFVVTLQDSLLIDFGLLQARGIISLLCKAWIHLLLECGQKNWLPVLLWRDLH